MSWQEVINVLNTNNGAIQALSTLILVGITGYYAWQTRKNVEALEKQNRPHVGIYVKKSGYTFQVIIGNYGNKIAHNISFKLKNDLVFNKKQDYKVSDIQVFNLGIKTLVPDEEHRVRILWNNDDEKIKNIKLNMVYSDVLDDSKGNQYNEEFELDFTSAIKQTITRSGTEKHLRDIANELRRMRSGIR